MAITKLLNNITGVPQANTSPHGRGNSLMRYYAKFNSGSQTKNKAQEAAYKFGKPAGGTLIGSDAALEKFIDTIIEGVNRITPSAKLLFLTNYLKLFLNFEED